MIMRRLFFVLFLAVFILGTVAFAFAKEASEVSRGGELFMANCKVCHPDGGNIINPKKTLHKADREANGVKTVEDVIKRMRNPGPGMTKFDEKNYPDKDARAIAEYVLKTFNK
jgi:cytochrome c6